MHINSNDLNNFQNEEMNTDEIIAFLEHMNHCDYCLNQLVDEYTDDASSAPAYLKGTIMAVSYTHLDVYKRQPPHYEMFSHVATGAENIS